MAEGTEEVEEPTPVVPEKGTFVFADGSQYGASARKIEAWTCCQLVKRKFEFDKLVVIADGEWVMVDGVRQRHGTGTYTDGPEKYDGEWKCDQMHGKGTLYNTILMPSRVDAF